MAVTLRSLFWFILKAWILFITFPIIVFSFLLGLWWTSRRGSHVVKVGSRVSSLASACPDLHSYRPFLPLTLPWLKGHLHTIVPHWSNALSTDQYDARAGLTRPDGARLGLWYYLGKTADPATPFVVLFPGLTGGAHEAYVLSMVNALKTQLKTVRILVVPGRGNHDSELGLPTEPQNLYNARATGDQFAVIQHVKRQHPKAPIFAIGFSLGANILVNCLADHPGLVDGAVVVSCPWDLVRSSRYVLERSIYKWIFGRALDEFATRNREDLVKLYQHKKGESETLVRFLGKRARSVLEFDEMVTAPMAGYKDARAYYEDASCHTRVNKVDVPLLALSALDDPCVDSRGMPVGSGSEFCTFVLTDAGGHLGFFRNALNWRTLNYADCLAVQWIGALIQQRKRQ